MLIFNSYASCYFKIDLLEIGCHLFKVTEYIFYPLFSNLGWIPDVHGNIPKPHALLCFVGVWHRSVLRMLYKITLLIAGLPHVAHVSEYRLIHYVNKTNGITSGMCTWYFYVVYLTYNAFYYSKMTCQLHLKKWVAFQFYRSRCCNVQYMR